ncbi:hypothetical protein A9K55_007915 [Cordyceps militaris]|uniref:Uncharacterized protein n=1 Tax=Cordyceps militaris TaxID=73501 RepID=A0A2H4SFJ1_CORMI|nr:hypothetical protein A9K55_007915 [Cordyceps militaris]
MTGRAATRGRGRGRGNPPKQTPSTQSKPPAARRPATRRICEYCSSDPSGQIRHALQPCDWTDGKYPLECSNCADHRALHPIQAAGHVCQVLRKPLLYRKYSRYHPARYDQALSPLNGQPTSTGLCCVKCAADDKTAGCDVDPILGYQCSRCKADDMCQLSDGRLMDNKPNLRQGVVRWFRHACDSCAQLAAARRVEQRDQCSWLADHTVWNQACDRCRSNNLVCIGSSIVAAMPAAISIPENWRPRSFIALGWAELRPGTVWRKVCMNCRRDSNHCRASIAAPYSACGRCTALGLDCVDHQGTAYPIFDLSQVGFGSYLPFTACRRCVQSGRNCDRQRPCDSCTNYGEAHLCDNAFLTTTAGKNRMSNCIHGRLTPRPGPLYYLAHGYGANGVTDVKDGSRMEHWIGPLVENYVMPSISFHVGTLVRDVSRQRESLIPRSTPPHAAPGTLLASSPASQLSANDLAVMINQVWPQSYLMNTLSNFAEEQRQARLRKRMAQFDTPAGVDDPPTAADIAAALNENPNFASVAIRQVVQPLPVVSHTSEEDEDVEFEEGEEEDEDEDSDQGEQGDPIEQSNNPDNVSFLPQPAAAPDQRRPILQQIVQTVATVASLSQPAQDAAGDAGNTDGTDYVMDIKVPEGEHLPIDPTLQLWDPATPIPIILSYPSTLRLPFRPKTDEMDFEMTDMSRM